MKAAQITDLVPVILAGGSGTRLWPTSRSLCPKHLVNLVGDKSLLQETALRLERMADLERLIVVGADSQGDLIVRQLATLAPPLNERLILEPAARNTAAAVALAALQAIKSFGDQALIFVCPSDHLILLPEKLHQAVEAGAKAARENKLVTFGIQPNRPETGFGYIKKGVPINNAPGVLSVDRFVEKPELQVAEAMLADQNHFWNSGMFLMKATTLLAELHKFEPQLATEVQNAFEQRKPDGGVISKTLFEAVKSMPIDKAVMERSSDVAVVPCDPNWSDLGSWHALWEIMDKDEQGNAFEGDAVFADSHNNLVKAETRLVALAGVSNLAIIETRDAILISDRLRSDQVKQIVNHLDGENRPEAKHHTRQQTAWGELDELEKKSAYEMLELSLEPKCQIDHPDLKQFDLLVVVEGTAHVSTRQKQTNLHPKSSILIDDDVLCIKNKSMSALTCIAMKFR